MNRNSKRQSGKDRVGPVPKSSSGSNGEIRSVCVCFAAGCPRSQTDVARLIAYFRANGLKTDSRIQDADLIVVATCGVEQREQQRSMNLLKVAQTKRKPGSHLCVVGCLVGINPSVVEEKFSDVTLVGAGATDKFDDLIGARTKLTDVEDVGDVGPSIRAAKAAFGRLNRLTNQLKTGDFSARAWRGFKKSIRDRIHPVGDVYNLRIAEGCLSECSYCAIRFVEGELRSRPLDRIIRQFENGLDQGYRTFHIVATDIGCYGLDIGTTFADLLDAIFRHDESFSVTLPNLNPRWLLAEKQRIIDILSDNVDRVSNVWVSVQSGSDRMLKLMGRKYTIESVGRALNQMRSKCPGIRLHTEVIVGFPGETESDLEQTIDFINDISFDQIVVYRYFDRPKAPASKLPDKVPQDVVARRVKRFRNEVTCADLVLI